MVRHNSRACTCGTHAKIQNIFMTLTCAGDQHSDLTHDPPHDLQGQGHHATQGNRDETTPGITQDAHDGHDAVDDSDAHEQSSAFGVQQIKSHRHDHAHTPPTPGAEQGRAGSHQ